MKLAGGLDDLGAIEALPHKRKRVCSHFIRNANASFLSLNTTETSVLILFFSDASIIDCKSVPPPDASTPTFNIHYAIGTRYLDLSLTIT